MSVEAITDTIHEYMYEKMNESKDYEEETKIKHVDRKRTYRKPESEKQIKFTIVDCIRCGAPNRNKSHDCPAMTRKSLRSLRKRMLIKTKLGKKNETYSTRLRSKKCRRR